MRWRSIVLGGGAVAALLVGSASAFAAEFTVKPGQSIQDAIEDASEGDTIYIKGAHNQSFTVTKPLNFHGKRASLTGIGLGGPIMVVESGGSGSTFNNLPYLFTDDGNDAVYLQGGAGDLLFSKCTFSGVEGTAVYCDGNWDVDYSLCQFSGNTADIYGWVQYHYEFRSLHRRSSGTAVDVTGSSYFETCSFDLCKGTALDLEDGALELSLGVQEFGGEGQGVQSCSISRSRGGISADWTSGLWISAVEGHFIRDGFLAASQCDSAEVMDCRAVVCGDNAYDLDGAYYCTISGSTAVKARTGIDIDGGENILSGNTVQFCDEGIYVGNSSGSAGAVVEYNNVLDITGIGIEVSGHDNPIIGGNTLRGVAAFEDYDWFEEVCGAIAVMDCYAPIVADNRVGDVDGGFGILVRDCDMADVYYNDVRGTLLAGIRVDADGEYYYPTLTLLYEGPGGYGYYNTVEYNTVVGCGDGGGAGIEFDNQGFFSITGNTVEGSGGVGIAPDWCWAGEINLNTVANSGRDGIWIMNGGDSLVAGNTVYGSGAEGIQNSSCNPVTIVENAIWTSTFRAIANNGSIDTENSGGNVNKKGKNIDPSDWYDIEPFERNYGGCDD